MFTNIEWWKNSWFYKYLPPVPDNSLLFFFGPHCTGKSTNAKMLEEYIKEKKSDALVIINDLSFDSEKRNIVGGGFDVIDRLLSETSRLAFSKETKNIIDNIIYLLCLENYFYEVGISEYIQIRKDTRESQHIIFTRSYDPICYILAKLAFLLDKEKVDFPEMNSLAERMFYCFPLTKYFHKFEKRVYTKIIVKYPTVDDVDEEVYKRITSSFPAISSLEDAVKYNRICNNLYRFLTRVMRDYFDSNNFVDSHVIVYKDKEFDSSLTIGL
jgi:hypothetical protein